MADQAETMKLTVNVPDRVLYQGSDIVRIIAESPYGTYGLLSHRLDMVCPLVTGILVFECADHAERYIALEEGVLVKAGLDVTVSVRSAVIGDDLAKMRELVETEFSQLSESEENVKGILAKIEDDFVRLYHEVRYD